MENNDKRPLGVWKDECNWLTKQLHNLRNNMDSHPVGDIRQGYLSVFHAMESLREMVYLAWSAAAAKQPDVAKPFIDKPDSLAEAAANLNKAIRASQEPRTVTMDFGSGQGTKVQIIDLTEFWAHNKGSNPDVSVEIHPAESSIKLDKFKKREQIEILKAQVEQLREKSADQQKQLDGLANRMNDLIGKRAAEQASMAKSLNKLAENQGPAIITSRFQQLGGEVKPDQGKVVFGRHIDYGDVLCWVGLNNWWVQAAGNLYAKEAHAKDIVWFKLIS